MLQSNIQVTDELGKAKQEINDKRGIDLVQYGVFRVADEGLDLQILLDETEENLDLRAFFVDVGDGFGCQAEVVGEENVNFAGVGILIRDAAQGLGALPAFGAGNLDSLIRYQPQAGVDETPLPHSVAGLRFCCVTKKIFWTVSWAYQA